MARANEHARSIEIWPIARASLFRAENRLTSTNADFLSGISSMYLRSNFENRKISHFIITLYAIKNK